jgi:hypothetical protein
MDNIDIIFDELKRIEIDIEKQNLSFHINTILDSHRDLYRAVNARGLNLDQTYSVINVTNFGCIIAYLAFVKHKPSKRPILITLSLTLIALYISLLENTCMQKPSPTKPLYFPNVKYLK